jgi:hypothetical protein
MPKYSYVDFYLLSRPPQKPGRQRCCGCEVETVMLQPDEGAEQLLLLVAIVYGYDPAA